jgi:radical SAM protein with 4Fe4S-binding SPASM domain
MEWDTFTKIADEITTWGNLMHVELMMQNEPLMDKDLLKYVRHIKSLKPGLTVGITTNAMFLDQKKAKEIAASGLDALKISLDCFTKETYETLHPGFSFEKAIDAIDYINNVRSDKLSVRLSFVLTNNNVKEFESFVRFAKNKGLLWQTVYLLNRAGNVKEYERMRLTKYSWRYRKLRFIHKYIYRTCTMPFFSMSILFNGDVLICCQDWRRQVVIGNIKNESLLSVWDSDTYNTLRKKISDCRFDDIITCKSCTLAELCS